MKAKVTILILVLFGFCYNIRAQVDVTATSGTLSSSYTTLKGAFDAINAGTHKGTITLGISGNTTETASAVLNASGSGSASYTSITISPTGGADRTISGAITAGSPLIDFSGADNVTINGLNSGGNSLTITNTTVASTASTSTLRFIGGATGNTITNCSIQGSFSGSATTNGGVIFFSTDGVTTNGNDNNTISYCNIGPAGTSLPSKCISSVGTTTSATYYNSGINISNNNIFDYFSANYSSGGIYLGNGNSDWTITNNKFYQTATRTQTGGAQHSAIWITYSSTFSGNNFQVSYNTIGFASSTGAGIYTFVGSNSSSQFIPIYISVGTTTASTIQYNTIKAIAISGSQYGSGTSSASVYGIYISSGVANVIYNTIGDMASTGSITFTSDNSLTADISLIYNYSSSITTMSNNNIGGISASNSSTGAANIYGIVAATNKSAALTCQNNILGGDIANSIQSNSTAAGTIVNGILITKPGGNISNNIIRNLTAAGGTGTTNSSSVSGICNNLTSTSSTAATISQNTIYGLSNTNTSSASIVNGIFFTTPTSSNIIERNLIHSLTVGNVNSSINGISVAGGTSTFKNNMIRLGFDYSGLALTTGCIINGINEQSGTDNFYFNSVYIGGTGVTGSAASYSFYSTVTSGTRIVEDNIFYNARSNDVSGTGKHYSIRIGGTSPNPTGLTINYNDYVANGTGSVFGFFNSLDVASLSDWKTAVGQDGNSIFTDPQFIAPNGSGTTGDLHINPTVQTPIEASGLLIASVTNDFDGQTRSTLTPTDIGADAGNFTGLDVSAPGIIYTTLTNTASSEDRVLSATITDFSGVPTSGSLVPRIYYSKGGGSYFSQPGTLSSGSGTNGSWNFSIIASDMGGVTTGDVISYYIIAQDITTNANLGSNPAGVAASNVNTITTPPASPNTYTILGTLSGSKTVGTGGDYTTITAAFADINSKIVSGPLTLILTDANYSETFPLTLNLNLGSSATNTITIKPNASTGVTISGASTSSIIKLNGAKYVIIDGVNSGGASLTISNTSTSSSTAAIWVASNGTGAGATNNTIQNCIISTGITTITTYGIFAGGSAIGSTGADNDYLTIQNNIIKKAYDGIYAYGVASTGVMDNLVITGNIIGSSVAADYIGYNGIMVSNGNNGNISNNTIFNILVTGAPTGISILSGFVNATINKNNISNIASVNSTSGYGGRALYVNTGSPASSLTISNNIINTILGDGNIAFSGSSPVGIYLDGITGGVNIYYNSVYMSGTLTKNVATISTCIYFSSSTITAIDLRNNIFQNSMRNTASSSAKNYSIYSSCPASSFTNINYNDYYVSGTQGVLGFLGSDIASLGAWSSATLQDANSISGNPLFSTTTDLRVVSGSPVLGTGTPITAVTTDYTGMTRNTLTPSIGAYENGIPQISYSLLGNTFLTTNIPLGNVSITDPDGIANGTTAPRVYWKVNSGSWCSAACTNTSSPYSFVIGAAGLTVGDIVYYFVIAQDALGNVNALPIAGLVAVDVNNVTTYPTSPNSFTIIANPNYGGGGTGTGGYYFANSTTGAYDAPAHPDYNWIDPVANHHSLINTWTSGNADDGYFTIPDLGFSFNFFENTYRTGNAFISTNGYISFGTGASEAGETTTIPSASSPMNIIAGCMMDLDLTPASYPETKVYYGTDARGFVITYWHVYSLSAGISTDYITFQIVLSPGGNILIQYNDAESKSPFASTAFMTDAVIGIENSDGTLGIGYRNDGIGGPMISSPLAISFGLSQGALPVELNSFSAAASERNAILKWETKTEHNSSKFIVERSVAGNNKWQSVGEVISLGSSNAPIKYSFKDMKLSSGKFNYRLKLLDMDGRFTYSSVATAEVELPKSYSISQNYPNPFNPSTRIDYQLPSDSKVTIELYSITGQKVSEIVNKDQSAGYYTIEVGPSALQRGLSSGVYIYRLVASDKLKGNNFICVKKMVMLK